MMKMCTVWELWYSVKACCIQLENGELGVKKQITL